MFVKVIRGPVIDNDKRAIAVRVNIWHDSASQNDPPFLTEDFRFTRDKATIQRAVVDPADGRPLLDDGSRAPVYTRAEARSINLAESPLLQSLKGLADAVVDPTTRAAEQAKVIALVDTGRVVEGQPYEPTGRTYQRTPRPTLDEANIKAVIRRRYDREVEMQAAATALSSVTLATEWDEP